MQKRSPWGSACYTHSHALPKVHDLPPPPTPCRLDETVMFEPLTRQHLRAIARLQVQDLNARLKQRSIALEASDRACDFAVAQSYNPLYGARPLRRWLEQHIITDLSRMIVAGECWANN